MEALVFASDLPEALIDPQIGSRTGAAVPRNQGVKKGGESGLVKCACLACRYG